jgi:SAM-dependent methyltransferase
MNFTAIEPPRVFGVGHNGEIYLKDCGRVELDTDEQVTFVTPSGTEYDVARKEWGYYATPSLNHRLPSLGLKPALVRSGERRYLLLVENGKEEQFHAYLKTQKMELLSWLHLPDKLEIRNPKSETQGSKSEIRHSTLDTRHLTLGWHCPLCGSSDFSLVFRYDAPPPGETFFPELSGKYYREIQRCGGCGHYLNVQDAALNSLYEGAYVQATYGERGLTDAYRLIMALPAERSDNCRRVERIVRFMFEQFEAADFKYGDNARPKVLDVGSGLCVFLKRMKEAGWNCAALDPDPRAAEHARKEVGIEAITGDFMKLDDVGLYDLVTFNKVLEHVPDPIAMLGKSKHHLKPGGVVYVEVPDGEAAAQDGPGREEFFIEHRCVFSPASLSLLAARAGFGVRLMERVREPSRKYTLRAFLTPHPFPLPQGEG